MSTEDLKLKILNSEAFTSLKFESKIKEVLEKQNWKCIQSPYYIDSNTNKLRELDIIAQKRFLNTSTDHEELTSLIGLLIESKSISGYHIIFDGETKREFLNSEQTYDIWMGTDSYNQHKKLFNILSKTKAFENNRKAIVKYFENRCFKEGVSIFSDYIFKTFNDIETFTSFRETKIGTSKTLENSVLWKAFQSLNSSSIGYENYIWNNIEEDLLMHLSYIEEYEQEEDLGPSLDKLFKHTNHYRQLHKVLVIDANLWVPNNGDLKKLKYCRLLQKNLTGNLTSWIDVVNQNYFKEYSMKITNHYIK